MYRAFNSSTKACTKLVYKNLINNTINMLDENMVYLKEFQRLSDFSFESDIMNQVITTLDKKELSKTFISKLKQLVDILGGEEPDAPNAQNALNRVESCAKVKRSSSVYPAQNSLAEQKLITSVYVNLYKDDNLETLASTVVDNVYEYLTQVHIAMENVNKNQIGKDLVDLGVKKIRKSRGYVYGITDTSHITQNQNVSKSTIPYEEDALDSSK